MDKDWIISIIQQQKHILFHFGWNIKRSTIMRKTSIFITLVLLIVALVGCEKFTNGYDTNPLRPSDADPLSIFIGAELGYTLFTEGFTSQIGSIWTQQIAGADRQFTGYQTYTSTTSYDFANDWILAYSSAFANLKIVESKSAGMPNLRGVARILEGIHMGTMTALWGNIPYSEANNPAITAPHYDAQLSVYTAVQTVLSAGITDLTNAANIARDMSSYGGNVSLWAKAGHSAKARYLMHVARHNSYAAADLNAVITEAQLGILATSGAEDLMLTHGTVQGGNQNIWYSFFVQDRTGYMDASSTFVIPMMMARSLDGKSNEKGRLNFYFDTTSSPFGINTTTGAYTIDANYPIIRASETHLLLAEAYARLNNASALTELNNARHYANTVFGNTSTDFVAGDFATPAALLQTILNEEYLALMHQLEAFNFVRRVNYAISYTDTTGGTTHTVAMTPAHGTAFPQRFFYSSDEINANVNTPPQTTNDLYLKTTVNTP
jgi:hypothetical protein